MKAKEAIQESGLTRAQLARDCGISEDTIWSWEAGRRKPSSGSLVKLAEGLRGRSDELRRIADKLEQTARDAG